jgi:hypothetical protein
VPWIPVVPSTIPFAPYFLDVFLHIQPCPTPFPATDDKGDADNQEYGRTATGYAYCRHSNYGREDA